MHNPFAKNQPSQNVEQISIAISGMHCTACSMNIDGELEDLDGVQTAETSYAKSRTQVAFDPDKVTTDQLLKVISDLGYEAQLVD